MKKYPLILMALIFSVSVTSAQDSLKANTRYLAIEISRMPFITGGYFLQDLLALEAGVGIIFDGESDRNGLGVRLGLDKYFGHARVAPLAGGFVMFEINPGAFQRERQQGSRLTLGGHWGLNMMLLEYFSLAGKVGAEIILASPKEGDNAATLTSFSSGIQFRFFF